MLFGEKSILKANLEVKYDKLSISSMMRGNHLMIEIGLNKIPCNLYSDLVSALINFKILKIKLGGNEFSDDEIKKDKSSVEAFATRLIIREIDKSNKKTRLLASYLKDFDHE